MSGFWLAFAVFTAPMALVYLFDRSPYAQHFRDQHENGYDS